MESSTQTTSRQSPAASSSRRKAPRSERGRPAREHLLEEQMLRVIAHYLRSGSIQSH